MKKPYTTPKLETAKINSEDSTAAFAEGNYNSIALVKTDSSLAANVISY
ncbi:MAG: hypothetical protein LUD77_10895 [Clostridiales bacterium]|nr:hypothetical protein [Clostridiales bacterium]